MKGDKLVSIYTVVALIAGLNLMVPQSSWGQESLSWAQCVNKVLDSNPDLRTAKYNLLSAQDQAMASRSDYFPQLSAKAGVDRSNSGSSSFGLGSTNLGTDLGTATTSLSGSSQKTVASQTLGVTQNIFSGFQTSSKVRQSQANVEASQQAFNIMAAKVNYDLKNAFAGLQYSQNNVKLTEDITRRREEDLRIVELRYESGNENKGSFLLSKASLGQAKFEQLQAKNSIAIASAQLAKVLGLDNQSDLRVIGDVAREPLPSNTDFLALVALAPELQQALAQQRAAKAAIGLAQSQYYPSIDVSGDIGRQEIIDGSDKNRWTVGLQLSVPLFSGGRDYYGVKSAKALEIAAASGVQSIGKQVLVKLKQAYTGYAESLEKLGVDKSFLEAATTRSEIARSKYDNGLLSFEDWDIIENDLINRQKVYIQSQRDLIAAQAAWDQAQGKGVKP